MKRRLRWEKGMASRGRALAGLVFLAGSAAAQMPAPPVFPSSEPRVETPSPVPPVEEAEPVAAVGKAQAEAGRVEEAAAEPRVRDPFWPVGYAPLPPGTDPEQTEAAWKPVGPVGQTPPKPLPLPDQWEKARAALTIRGISRMGSGGVKAFINGRFVGEGDVVEQMLAGARYRWRVRTIGERAIELQQLDAVRLEGPRPAP